MSPGGHLITSVAACTAAVALHSPWALTAGLALGGFLIDVDHAVDYVLVDGQRDLRPGVFLRYYLEGRPRRTVLVLHSYELFALLGLLAWRVELPTRLGDLLVGYLMGGLVHLVLDLLFNGELTPRSIGAFYSFGYRLAHRFDAATLLGRREQAVSPNFWAAFFSRLWPPATLRRPRAAAAPRPPIPSA